MFQTTVDIALLTEDTSQQNLLLNLQKRVLESIVRDPFDFQSLLDNLCIFAEQLVPNALASIMLFDGDRQHLNIAAGPHVPEAIVADLAQLVPSRDNGSCANAVYSGIPTYVSNTLVDPRWSAVRNVAEMYQVCACWSHPVFFSAGEPIGTFALSSLEQREPDDFQKNVMHVCANLAGMIYRQKQQDEKLWTLAHHDALTGLPNRLYLEQQLEHAIGIADRNQKLLAVMFIDLDNFKDINDSYGHDFGDQVLLQATQLLKQCLRAGDIVARLGGDEFIIVLENLTNKMSVNEVARKILGSFQSPLTVLDKKVSVHFSIGISLYPDNGATVTELMQNADIAMYQAKSGGKNAVEYFEQELADRIHEKVQVEQRLREALVLDEFELYYQPQFIADSQQLDAVEVLLRWNHPLKGQMTAARFLPIAEESSLINDISFYVLEHAFKQIAQWIQEGYDLPKVAINFSLTQLMQNSWRRLVDLIDEYDVPVEKIEFEVTEALLINRGERVIQELNNLKDLGVTLTMDDFGTGYSSLGQLKRLPIDKLKIDQSFIQSIETNSDDQAIVKTIIAMGKSLGKQVVAEGVETQAQQAFLLANDCQLIQGDLRASPSPASEVEKLFRLARI